MERVAAIQHRPSRARHVADGSFRGVIWPPVPLRWQPGLREAACRPGLVPPVIRSVFENVLLPPWVKSGATECQEEAVVPTRG